MDCERSKCFKKIKDLKVKKDLVVCGRATFRDLVVASPDFNLCGKNLIVSQITACDLSTPIQVNGSFSFSGGGGGTTINNLSVCNIKSCSSGQPINIQGDVNVSGVLNTSTISSTSGTTQFTNNTQFNQNVTLNGNLTACNGSLTIASVHSCNGNPITFDGPVSFTGNVSYTSISTDSITPPSGTLTINGNETVTGTLSVNTISPGTAGYIDFTGPVHFCGGSSITVDTLGACSGTLTVSSVTSFSTDVTVGGTLNLCSSTSGLFTSAITACGGTTLTITGPTSITGALDLSGATITGLSIDSITPPSGTLTINGNETITGTLSACAGVSTDTITPCTGTVTVDGILDAEGGLTVNTITAGSQGYIDFGSDIHFCNPGARATFDQIYPCAGVPITINSDVVIPAPFTLDVNEITPASGTLTLDGTVAVNTISAGSAGFVDFLSDVHFCNGVNIVLGNVTSCSGGPVTFNADVVVSPGFTLTADTINTTNYNLTNANESGTGVSLLGTQTGPGGNTRTFQTLTSSDTSISETSDGTTIDLKANIFMDRDMFINPLPGGGLELSSVYGSNFTDFVYNTPTTYTANTWTPLVLTSVNFGPAPNYFAQVGATNYFGPINPSPTNTYEAPGDGYTGLFDAEIAVAVGIPPALCVPGVDIISVLVGAIDIATGNLITLSPYVDPIIYDPQAAITSIQAMPPGNGNVNINTILRIGAAQYNSTTQPIGAFLYYSSATVPTITTQVFGYFRAKPLNR
jgi:hypothetical protein